MGTILFVHGTGVRLGSYKSGFDNARRVAYSCGLRESFAECAWGEALGIEFRGRSLPGPVDAARSAAEAAEFAEWSWLFDDPLFELDKLTIRDASAHAAPGMPGAQPEWEQLWERIKAYEPSIDLTALLERGDLLGFWKESWAKVIGSPISRTAFEASAHELPDASRALARALVAQLHVCATDAGAPGPNAALRGKIRDRLLSDWDQHVFGLGTFFADMLKRTSTSMLRRHRSRLSDAIAAPVGDILLYQSRGEAVRKFIRAKVAAAAPPVTIVSHSLGGIACVDLLAMESLPAVAHLVTAGSQSPLLYELSALQSMRPPEGLPAGFPPWLNVYDRNDFLSYVANPFWPTVTDFEVESGQPFPDSHSAYFGNEQTWQTIAKFIAP